MIHFSDHVSQAQRQTARHPGTETYRTWHAPSYPIGWGRPEGPAFEFNGEILIGFTGTGSDPKGVGWKGVIGKSSEK